MLFMMAEVLTILTDEVHLSKTLQGCTPEGFINISLVKYKTKHGYKCLRLARLESICFTSRAQIASKQRLFHRWKVLCYGRG